MTQYIKIILILIYWEWSNKELQKFFVKSLIAGLLGSSI